MLDKIYVTNFKALRNIQTELERLTVIAGPNACGKTSVLEALNLLGMLRTVDPNAVFAGRFAPEVIITQQSGAKLELYAAMKEGGSVGCGVSPAPESPKSFIRWSIERMPDQRDAFIRSMPPTLLAQLRATELSEPSGREEGAEGLRNDGRGLPSVLATLKLTAPQRFDDLLTTLRAVVPSVKDLFFEAVDLHTDEPDPYQRIRTRPGFQFRFEMANAAELPAYAASEGTLLTLGLLAVLASPKHPKLLLLDNIDAGLHPRAGGELIGQLRKIMSTDPELQIVVTTHSPYVLDHFQPQEIRLMTSDDAGHAIIGSLTDHPQFERWKEEMLPGEFWSTVGEDWLKKRETQGA